MIIIKLFLASYQSGTLGNYGLSQILVFGPGSSKYFKLENINMKIQGLLRVSL